MGNPSKHPPETLALGAVRAILITMSHDDIDPHDRLKAVAFVLATYGFATILPDHKRANAFDAYLKVTE